VGGRVFFSRMLVRKKSFWDIEEIFSTKRRKRRKGGQCDRGKAHREEPPFEWAREKEVPRENLRRRGGAKAFAGKTPGDLKERLRLRGERYFADYKGHADGKSACPNLEIDLGKSRKIRLGSIRGKGLIGRDLRRGRRRKESKIGKTRGRGGSALPGDSPGRKGIRRTKGARPGRGKEGSSMRGELLLSI